MKRLFTVIFYICILPLLISNLYAVDGTITAAVMEITAKEGVSQNVASIISDYLRTELVNTQKFTIVTRENMTEVLKEQNLQLSGCTSQECIIQVGKILGVNKVILGTIGKIGTVLIINIKMIDVETGKIDKAQSRDVVKEEELLRAIRSIAKSFAGIEEKNTPIVSNPQLIRKPIGQRKPVRKIPGGYMGYGFFDLSYAFGFGNMQLQFIRSDPEMTAGEFGISGDIPATFSSINWATAKVAIKVPITFKLGGFFPSRKHPNKPGKGFALDFFYLKANIIPQTTDSWWINNEKTGSFTFHSDDYFVSNIMGMDIYYLWTLFYQQRIHSYLGFGIGFTFNSWEAPYIMGYTESDSFSAPSKGTTIGFDIPMLLGFRFNLTKSMQFFFEYNFMLSGFKPNRNVKDENNLAGYFIHRIQFGISLFLH
ncbi:hypothetical protein J7L48_04755 [bacterium]|nr:hypothetical protein [bacterium]